MPEVVASANWMRRTWPNPGRFRAPRNRAYLGSVRAIHHRTGPGLRCSASCAVPIICSCEQSMSAQPNCWRPHIVLSRNPSQTNSTPRRPRCSVQFCTAERRQFCFIGLASYSPVAPQSPKKKARRRGFLCQHAYLCRRQEKVVRFSRDHIVLALPPPRLPREPESARARLLLGKHLTRRRSAPFLEPT